MFQAYTAKVTYGPFGLEGITMNNVIGRTRKDALALARQTMTEVGIRHGMDKKTAEVNAQVAKIRLSKVK